MFKIRPTRLSKLFILIGLLIVPVFLGACGTAANTAAAVPGLREMAADTTSESVVSDTIETNVPAVNDVDTTVNQPAASDAQVGNNGNGQARTADRSAHVFDPNTAPALSQEEMDGLAFMREEEKLARDVYLALYEQWGVSVFQNIAGSEQAHMDSILMLLEQYDLADPAAGLGAGEFSNPLFQSLYEELLGQGSLSQAGALTVGATIEELDIVDLQARLAQTENEYIIQVYNNLLAGSENHLRAFVSNLERQTGIVYQPIYLNQEAYQAIMNGSAGQGNGQGGSGQGGNGQGGNGQGGNGNRNGSGGGGGNGRGNGRNSSS